MDGLWKSPVVNLHAETKQTVKPINSAEHLKNSTKILCTEVLWLTKMKPTLQSLVFRSQAVKTPKQACHVKRRQRINQAFVCIVCVSSLNMYHTVYSHIQYCL